ncbi:glycosyltransferase family 2 protein [Clostridium sp. BL-8]|uniref:glycosyltransferase family 2 protein n=1 Tax=Clostridium sp. BL-8 TaxID=349938 RepID=UPI00098CA074|nr:glycosyltransferase family 2 protein [Clostridium sp. BL-8]OOM75332.1 putative glycosyltransferase YkoT [Clostridium sp. BL-8]
MNDILYLVIPCYNEEEVLPETSKRLLEKINYMIANNLISDESKILFVNDGSKDKTWSIIEELNVKNTIFSGINLSRNRGHQNALLAGLMTAKEYADMTISLDADLQDDVDVIDKFVEQYYSGCDIVYGVRCSRQTDTFFKRSTALAFYKLMNGLGVDMVYNHADYRLMSKRALDGLSQYEEVNLFLRGMIPLIGYKYSIVEYERHERFAGESKYPLKKMIAFALDGITSLSIKPIRIITFLGFTIFFISGIASIYSLIVKFLGTTVTGWTSLTLSIWMLGGIQLLSLGVIGEYIGKIYNETKRRPRFIIADKLINTNKRDS